jgi:hypothetical protein
MRSFVGLGGSLVVVMMLAACADATAPCAPEVARHRALWSAGAIRDYSFEYEVSGDYVDWSARPIRVIVLQGRVRLAVLVTTGESIPSPAASFPTIDQLFDEASTLACHGLGPGTAFDESLGFPTRIQSIGPADGPVIKSVGKLQRLP